MDIRYGITVFILTASLQLTLGQDLTGCGTTKGCYKKPSDCTGDDCTAYVTWENVSDGNTRFAMRAAHTPNLAWVAVGLRPQNQPSGMVPADVYVCTRTGTAIERTENIVTAQNRWDSVARVIPAGAVTDESISFADSAITCTFTRNASVAGDATFFDISGDNVYYLLLAVGNDLNGDGSISGTYHASRWSTPVALKLQSEFEVPPEPELVGCGTTRGCYQQPSTCTGDDCTVFVTWENVAGGQTRFTMRASQTQNLAWVAVGLRPETQSSGMVPADVYVCTSNGTAVERTENVLTAQNRWNSETRAIPAGSVTTQFIQFEDNAIACVFTRSASMAGDSTFFDISGDNAYYLLLAVGEELNGDGTINGTYHADRWSTPAAMKLQSDFAIPTQPPATVPPGEDLQGCGDSRGCFRQPSDCSGDNCQAYVTWQALQDGRIRFTMRGQAQSWVAVGLRPSSVEDGMSPADVYACTQNREVKRSENVSPYDSPSREIPPNTVTEQAVTIENNAIRCMFTRQASLEGDSTFYNVSGDNRYFLLLATGNSINNDGTINGTYHADRWSTPAAMKLQSDFAIPTQPPATVPPGEDLQGCGDTRGCFRQPSDCSGDNCLAYVTWQALQDGQIRFTMRGQAQSWVAVGLRPSSVEDGMSPADVYACTQNREVKRSENVTPYDSPSREIPPNTVTEQAVTIEKNAIRCMFTRRASLEGNSTFYNVSGDNRYFLLLATGNSINNDGTIAGHRHEQRWPSTETFKLTEFGEATGETRIIALAKAHASLMMIAWIGFASIGITLARFFKPMWPESKLLGQKVWFTIHRICMVICVVCFVVAFILIFVFVKGFVGGGGTAVAHAICGIIVTCLGIINPIMAVFRPHPGTPKRPIFNWAHWAVGTSAHMLAVVTIFLGIGYQTSLLTGLASYSFFVMLAFTIFHVAMWIAFEVQSRVAESQGRSNDMPLKTTGGDSSQQLASTGSEPPAGAMVKIILLFTYIVGVVSFLIFLVVVIGLAGNNI